MCLTFTKTDCTSGDKCWKWVQHFRKMKAKAQPGFHHFRVWIAKASSSESLVGIS